jgi:hypothetical protein
MKFSEVRVEEATLTVPSALTTTISPVAIAPEAMAVVSGTPGSITFAHFSPSHSQLSWYVTLGSGKFISPMIRSLYY